MYVNVTPAGRVIKIYSGGRTMHIGPDGTIERFKHLKRHYMDGPAVVCPDGSTKFFIEGKELGTIEYFAIYGRT